MKNLILPILLLSTLIVGCKKKEFCDFESSCANISVVLTEQDITISHNSKRDLLLHSSFIVIRNSFNGVLLDYPIYQPKIIKSGESLVISHQEINSNTNYLEICQNILFQTWGTFDRCEYDFENLCQITAFK